MEITGVVNPWQLRGPLEEIARFAQILELLGFDEGAWRHLRPVLVSFRKFAWDSCGDQLAEQIRAWSTLGEPPGERDDWEFYSNSPDWLLLLTPHEGEELPAKWLEHFGDGSPNA